MPYKATVKLFKGIWEYCSWWDKKVEECIASNTQYARELLNRRQEIDRELRRQNPSVGELERLQDWYGSPIPKSWQDATDRRTFQNMALFNNIYDKLSPHIQKLEKISNSILPKDMIRPNDKNLGVFSLERALMSPEKILGLWSKKHEKFFYLGEGDQKFDEKGSPIRKKIKVFEDDKEEIEAVVFKLKKDGSEAYLTQLSEGISYSSTGKALSGEGQWGSLNKKSFLYKEKLPRPQRSVRIFVDIGANGNKTELYWAGVGATIISQFLMSKGYAVRITAINNTASTWRGMGEMRIAPDRPFRFKENNTYIKADGYRLNLMDVKGYGEELDTLGLLYPLADASFYRVRCFDYFMAEQWFFGDDLSTGLYSVPDFDESQTLIEEKIKEKSIEDEKDTLYYFIGGDSTASEQGIKDNIEYIVCDAERRNKELLEKLGYFSDLSDPLMDTSALDCQEILRRIKANNS